MAHPTAPTAGSAGDRSGLAGDTVRRIMHIAAAIRHYQGKEIAALGLTPAVARRCTSSTRSGRCPPGTWPSSCAATGPT